ncbi:MAG: Gfo/Idh/MocA family oxidoreductase [Sedimentisphaerales bacterium]|nr:Gfo/Idh/MocA family oxidoreductase [Sedimentisphaerales bacterium]
MSSGKLTRRSFIKEAMAGAIGFPYVVSSSALGKAGSVAPSERVVLGAIGVGPQGAGVLGQFLGQKDVQVVAVCDVKRPVREKIQNWVNSHYDRGGCAAYNDFRELIARDDIDAVSIASTDHWHVLHALCAARAGKDMYVEKPLGLSLQEGQVLRDAIQQYSRKFQFGTQQRSDGMFRFACELALNGRIGKIHTIEVGTWGSHASGTFPKMPVPNWIDYEMWLGPAPWAPYTEKRVINDGGWWHISDYALGFIAGWGIHHVDIAQWGNGTELTGPVEVEGVGVYPPDGMNDVATDWDVNLKYANGVTVHFTNTKPEQGRNPQGVKFEGTEGWVFVRRGFIDAHPKSLLQEVIGPNEIHLPVSNHHQRNLIDCIRTRNRTVAPIDVAVRSDTICQISDIALRLGRKLKWDPDQENFVGDAEANRMLHRAMRSPWKL